MDKSVHYFKNLSLWNNLLPTRDNIIFKPKKWMVSLSNNFGILTVLKIKKMFSNERTWSHYSTSGIIQDCRHQQASSTFSPPVRNEAKKEKKAGSSLTPPPLIAQSVLQHCRHRTATRSRLRDPAPAVPHLQREVARPRALRRCWQMRRSATEARASGRRWCWWALRGVGGRTPEHRS